MINPDRMIGPWRLRVWGLILNFIGNAMALFGIVAYVEEGAVGLLIAGSLITVACIAVLSIPSRNE